jgi:hypothetical protein
MILLLTTSQGCHSTTAMCKTIVLFRQGQFSDSFRNRKFALVSLECCGHAFALHMAVYTRCSLATNEFRQTIMHFLRLILAKQSCIFCGSFWQNNHAFIAAAHLALAS